MAYLDAHAERQTVTATGWYARILQHEIDHLNSTLYIDRMQRRTFMSTENLQRHWKDKSIREVQMLLGC